ncbi:MAG: MtrB/PioB family decaheme-associated outer membrane protein [Magnetococcales bacterium]|nr:MtrB/PioB family decaheme-associated outer membrane protein [Magnetococcales bacterium]
MTGNASICWTCVAAFLLGSGIAWAEEEKTENQSAPWGMCPAAAPYTTPESSISVGLGYLDGSRQKFGMFDGQNHTGGLLLLEGRFIRRNDATGTWNIAQGRNLGLNENRDIRLGFEKQGEWGVRVDYNETPRLAPYTVNSKTEGLGTASLVIPKTSTSGDGATYQIKTERDRFAVNTFRTLNRNIKLNLNFRNETKEGTRQWGRGGANEFALEPIDWTMRQLEPTIGYVGKSWQLLGGYSGSWFKNENSLVDTIVKGDNPSILSNHTYLSLPMNNEAHQVFLSGGYNFTSETRTTFKVSYGRALQNEHLPTKDVSGLSLAAAPSSLQGRVDTTLVQLGLTTKPLSDFSITSKLRYHDEDDRTPPWLVVSTPLAQVHSTPASIRTITGQVEGTYRLPYQSALTGGVEHKDQKRQVPFGSDSNGDGLDDERFVPWRTDIDETTYRLQVRRQMSETINGSLGFEHGDRTGSPYVDSLKIMGNAQGKINPFFIADRDRDKLRFAMDWRPFERLGFQFNVENVSDRYGPDQVPYGQKKGNAQLYSVDVDYAPVDNWLLTAWYSYDINKTWQNGGRWTMTTNAHEADKMSILKDQGSSIGLGVRNQWNDKIRLGTHFQFTRSKASFNDTVTVDPNSALPAYPAGVTPLPEIVTPTTRFGTFIEYKGIGPGTLRFDYAHEYWRTNDWTWKFSDGSPYTYGTITDGTVISTKESQSSDYFGIRYTTRFK